VTIAWWRRILRFRFGKEKNGELPNHVELWIRELIEEGMDPQAAREEALRCFGLAKPTARGGRPVPEPEDDQPPICMKLTRLP
jgi:hypothetical protein